jgi:uncharacterized protein YukE
MSGITKVDADAPEMERFASELVRFNHDLWQTMARLNAQFARLGESWRDPAYENFAREMHQTGAHVRQLMAAAEQYSIFLKRKAEKIRAVHG